MKCNNRQSCLSWCHPHWLTDTSHCHQCHSLTSLCQLPHRSRLRHCLTFPPSSSRHSAVSGSGSDIMVSIITLLLTVVQQHLELNLKQVYQLIHSFVNVNIWTFTSFNGFCHANKTAAQICNWVNNNKSWNYAK